MSRPHRTDSRIAGMGMLPPLLLMALSLAIAGCSRFGNSMLEIAPTVFSECRGVNISVHVAWDATSVVKRGTVQLFVHKPGHLPTLWRQGPPKGEADTGEWASDGWTITLVDDDHNVLSTRTLQTTPCTVKDR